LSSGSTRLGSADDNNKANANSILSWGQALVKAEVFFEECERKAALEFAGETIPDSPASSFFEHDDNYF